MSGLYLLVAISEPGYSELGARATSEFLGFATQDNIEPFIADLRRLHDPRVVAATSLRAYFVPDMGVGVLTIEDMNLSGFYRSLE